MKKIFLFAFLIVINVFAQSTRHSDELIIFRTTVGDMVAALYPDVAPQHTTQILKLVRGGIYTNKLFFRTEPDFVTQVENHITRTPPLSAEELKLIEKIPAEFNGIHHRRGILSMARFEDPNSAESSFSFMLSEKGNLDGRYTVFGEVIKNIEVLDQIEKLPPKTVRIVSAEVINAADLPKVKLIQAHAPNLEFNLEFFLLIASGLGMLFYFGYNFYEVWKQNTKS